MSKENKEKQAAEQAAQEEEQLEKTAGNEAETDESSAIEAEQEADAEEKADDNTVKGEKKSFFSTLGGKSKNTKLQEELDESLKKNEELKDKYLRLYADFDNYKKRSAKERIELSKEAGKDIILDLLPVLDDFDRALQQFEKDQDPESIKQGVSLIREKLMRSLQNKGLKPMNSQGEAFDTEFHEAITEIPAPSEEEKGKVVDVIEKGYTLNDKIIRYAKVVVGK